VFYFRENFNSWTLLPIFSSLPEPAATPALINYVEPEVFFIVDNKKKKGEVFQKREIANRWIY